MTRHYMGVPIHMEGPCYVAPDSAAPLPDTIWQRIDLEALDETMERLDNNADNARILSPEAREYLLSIGGPVTQSMLKEIDK